MIDIGFKPSWRTYVLTATLVVAGTGLVFSAPPNDQHGADATVAQGEAGDFFERQIRPLLAGHCWECHDARKQAGGLRLDSRAAVLRGGESGPVVVSGKPESSRLIAAVRRAGDLQMPPETKLNPAQVAALTEWVRLGLFWPDTATSRDRPAAPHWAFQPVRDPPLPKTKSDTAGDPIEAFVQSRLEHAGIAPASTADPRTLIRRATYDLTGLPPTSEEVEAFVRACQVETPRSVDSEGKAGAAYEQLVDRLLASPHYGEQWARHWLDVARYSDTKGYVYAREERFWIHAWAYRDWVVKALNQDMPYDRFVLLQIAADQLVPASHPDLAAMGFLTLGRRFLGVSHDIIDDRIDVVTRGTMGLTVACARCHDHKYDPIPTRDYYSLYGVFMNCREQVLPIDLPVERDAALDAFHTGLRERQQKLAEAIATARAETARRVRARVGDYLFAQSELQKYPEDDFNQVLLKDDVIPAFVRRWQAYLAQAEERRDPIFLAWQAYARIPPADFADQAVAVTQSLQQAGKELHPLVAQQFETPPQSLREVAQRYGQLFARIEQQWQTALEAALQAQRDPPRQFDDPSAESLRSVLYGPSAPCEVPDEPIVHIENYFDLANTEALWKLQGEVDRWLIRTPAAPAHAVILVDRETQTPSFVFKRGNPKNKGDLAPRQFPEVALAGRPRQPFQQGSGRLELARAIVDPNNPLTARVIVNRIWLHHFGAGLVRTPSDFGKRAESPSHPELLDWLTARFVEDGWSLKKLHRRIMLSAAYRRNSQGPADAASRARAEQVDPQNRLLWRMNVRRLSFEELRDSLLTVSGRLELSAGGKPSDLFGSEFRRRTLYGLIDRQFLPSALRVFDFASPDLHIPVRSETTSPQQALFFLNHPLLLRQARELAVRTAGASSDDARIRALFRLAYQREPTAEQAQAALSLVRAAEQEPAPAIRPTAAAWSYGFGEVDEMQGQVRGFTPLPHFNGKAFQGGPNWPDAKLGWVQLTAEGGHAGNDKQHAAIRRWTAPTEMRVQVESMLDHAATPGDGVRGFVVHGRQGILKSVNLHHAQSRLDQNDVKLQAGDTLDFAVDLGGGLNSDQFTWTVQIKPLADGTASVASWHSQQDFSGPAVARLGAWEQLAQVLLSANEFVFLD